jgi:hypothetical protein
MAPVAACSTCCRHACEAHAVTENGDPIDGNNKVCKLPRAQDGTKRTHAHMMAQSARASRERSRD